MSNEGFSIHKGLKSNLPTSMNPGRMYITSDTCEIFLDTSDSERIYLCKSRIVYVSVMCKLDSEPISRVTDLYMHISVEGNLICKLPMQVNVVSMVPVLVPDISNYVQLTFSAYYKEDGCEADPEDVEIPVEQHLTNLSHTYNLNLREYIPVTGLDITPKYAAFLDNTGPYTNPFTVTITPSNATDQRLIWKLDSVVNEVPFPIITSSDGGQYLADIVPTLPLGKYIYTATTFDGIYSCDCDITVNSLELPPNN